MSAVLCKDCLELAFIFDGADSQLTQVVAFNRVDDRAVLLRLRLSFDAIVVSERTASSSNTFRRLDG